MSTCTVTGTLKMLDGSLAPQHTQLTIIKAVKSGAVLVQTPVTAYVLGSDGIVTFTVPRGCNIWLQGEAFIGGTNINKARGAEFTVPDSATATLESLGAAVTGPTAGLTVQNEGVALPGLYSAFNFVGSGVDASVIANVLTVTITGAVSNLDDLADVVITSPTNGQGLIYDTASGHWINGAVGGGSNPLTTLGDTLYGASGGTQTRLAGNVTATRKFYRQVGNGSVSAAPAWDVLVSGDIPDLSATYAAASGLAAHIADTGNPHGVTKTQVGLGNVANSLQLVAASNLSDVGNASTSRTNLGVAIGTNVQAFSANLTTFASIAPSTNVQTLLGAANFSAFRSSLGVAVGTDVQAWDADLDIWSGKAAPSGVVIGTTDTQSLTNKTFDAGLNTLSNLATSMFAANVVDTDATLAANSATRLPAQSAVKSYVDNLLTGLKWKASVVAATTANITLSGEQTIDGVAVVTGDRVLVKNQSTASQNGIYIAASGSWTRSTDADAGSEMVQATCFVQDGTTNADTQWTCTNNTVTLGSTAIAFAQVSGAGTYSNGAGLSLTGNQFAIDSTVATLTGSQTLANKTLTSPTINAPAIAGGSAAGLTGLALRSAGSGAFDLTLANSENLSAGRTLTIALNDAARSLTIAGNATISGTNTGDQTSVTGNAGTATALQTARAIYGNSFDGTAALTQVIASTYGGTGNGFAKFSGPASSEKTFTLPNASATILTDNAAVSIAQGGSGQATANAALNAFLPSQTSNSGKFLTTDGSNTSWGVAGSGANPSASVGLSAVNGIASTFLRSDGAPALDQSIAPLWSALHQFALNIGLNGGSYKLYSVAPTQASSTAAGNALALNASDAVAGSSSAGAAAGGSVTITAGDAKRLTSGNGNGGNINLSPGNLIGSGNAGQVIISATGTASVPEFQLIVKNNVTASGPTAGIILTSPNSSNASDRNWAVGTNITAHGSFDLQTSSTNANNPGTTLTSVSAIGEWTFTSNSSLYFGSSGIASVDLGLHRNGVGILEVNNGTAGQWGSILAGKRDAATNTLVNGLTLSHQTSGTQSSNAAGLGIGIAFNINSKTVVDSPAARIGAIWTDPTEATATADLVFYTRAGGGALAEGFRLTGAGSLSLLGGLTAAKAFSLTPRTLTDAATVATDASLGNNFRVTLAGNRTLGNPTNASDGQVITWEIIQDGTGSRTVTLDTKFAFGTDITSVTLTTTASKRDFLTVIYNSTADLFYVRGFVRGY